MYEYMYYIAMAVIILTHLYIIARGGMPESESVAHAYINLVAAAAIAYYFYSHKLH